VQAYGAEGAAVSGAPSGRSAETIAVRTGQPWGLACVPWGSCDPSPADGAPRQLPGTPARKRSSSRLKYFLMMLPLTTPPGLGAAGSCGSQNTGTLETR